MNQRRLIFLAVFGAYHLLSLIFTLYIDGDTSVLLSLVSKVYLFKYGAFFGLILFITELVWTWRDSRSFEKEVEAMRHENNVLKAKVYDLTDGGKKSA
ncbi:MAG: hypothetical protein ACKOE6_01525 [Flammeovirgaceae bacterium]